MACISLLVLCHSLGKVFQNMLIKTDAWNLLLWLNLSYELSFCNAVGEMIYNVYIFLYIIYRDDTPFCVICKVKEVPRDVRNSKFGIQDDFGKTVLSNRIYASPRSKFLYVKIPSSSNRTYASPSFYM